MRSFGLKCGMALIQTFNAGHKKMLKISFYVLLVERSILADDILELCMKRMLNAYTVCEKM